MIQRSVSTSPLEVRAAVERFNADDRTVDLVFSTGAEVDRYDYRNNRPFVERLSLDPKHVRLARLNAGASALDAHSGYSIRNVIGAVVPGSAKIERAARLVGSVLLSRRAEVADILTDIRDGIVRFASIGYKVFKYRDDGVDARGVQILTAIDWEPAEVSFGPIPADVGAQTRADDPAARLTVPVIASDGDPLLSERNQMEPNNDPAIPAAPPAAPPAPPVAETRGAAPVPAPVPAPYAPPAATIAEVRALCKGTGLDAEFVLKLAERGLTLDAARAAVLEAVVARNAASEPRPAGGGIVMGDDADDKWQRGAGAWLAERTGTLDMIRNAAKSTIVSSRIVERLKDFTGGAGEFRGMSLIDLAREALERRGVHTRGMSRMDLAGAAFAQRGAGAMAVGDFPSLLESVLGKVLLASYATTPDTWSKWAKRGTVTDFRASNRYRLGSFSVLDALTQSGEFKSKPINDAEKATITASTKGNIVAVTRQLIVNDDLGGLTDMLAKLGRAAMLTVEVDAYALLAQNGGLGPTQADTNPLFHLASRGNVGTAAALSAASLDADAALMAAQKDPGSNEFLSLEPAILLVPRGLKGQALVINGAEFDPDNLASGSKATSRPNVARGLVREVVATPRLTGTRRYMFADPSVAPVAEVVFLEGEESPVLEARDGWQTDGSELRVRFDFGVGAIDYRGAVTNAGA